MIKSKFASRKFLIAGSTIIFLAGGALSGEMAWASASDWIWRTALAYLGAEGGADVVSIIRKVGQSGNGNSKDMK